MAYKALPQARALSRRRTEQVGIILPEIPALNGKLAQIDPDGTRQFNAVMARMIRNIAEQIQKLPVDLSPEVLQFITTTVQAAVAEALANQTSPGPP